MSTTTMPAARRNQNLYRQPTTLKFGPISTSFATVAIIGLLAGLYLNQVTKTTVLGYKVADLTEKTQELQASRQNMSVEAARLQSIKYISDSANRQGLVSGSKVTYAR